MADIYDANTAANSQQTNQQQDQNWVQRNSDWLTPLATSVAQIGYNVYSNKEQQRFNAEQAELNRNYEERMSNTAYQRAYADMKAAGLNPHLAGGSGGASTPAGSSAASNQMNPLDMEGLNAYALQTALTRAQVDNMNADTEQKRLSNKWIDPKTKAEIANVQAQTELTQAQAEMARKEFEILSEEDQIRQATLMDRYEQASHHYNAQKERAKIEDEWAHTAFGRHMIRQGLGLAQVGQIMGPVVGAASVGRWGAQ